MSLKNNDNKIYIFSWLIYSLLTLIAVLHHEPNRDEAQVWLIVRDLNLSGIFSQINIEGHPCLWYLIVMPLAKAALPYISMLLVHWLIAVITIGLFLFKAPLNKLIKLLFVFSYFMLFQYAVIARDYCIVILFLFLIATYYQSRFTKAYLYALLLVGLYNCHVLIFGGAFALTLIYFIEAKSNGQLKNLKYPLLIMLCGALSVILQLFPHTHSTQWFTPISYIPHLNIDTWWITLTSIQDAFIPVDSEYEELKVALFFTIILLLFFISNIRKKPVLIFLLITFGWFFYILTTIHSGGLKQRALILIAIIFTLWISNYYINKENRLSKIIYRNVNFLHLERALLIFLAICLAINVIFGLSNIKKEYVYEFSGSKSMANYIINNNLQSKEIACYRSWRATAVAPYLPNTKFWFLDRKEYGTYFKFDSLFVKYGDNLSEKEVINRTKEKYNAQALLLLNEPLTITSDSSYNYKLLFRNIKLTWGTDDENYFLYDIHFN